MLADSVFIGWYGESKFPVSGSHTLTQANFSAPVPDYHRELFLISLNTAVKGMKFREEGLTNRIISPFHYLRPQYSLPAVAPFSHGFLNDISEKIRTPVMTDLSDFEETLKQISDHGGVKTATEWMENIEIEYGRAPLIFKRMAERPEVLISHLLYKGTVTRTSSMEPKYVELISMAVGAALKCKHCTSYHMQAAAKKGATREEILETILVAGLISNSSVLANAYRIFDEKMAGCIPCENVGMKDK